MIVLVPWLLFSLLLGLVAFSSDDLRPLAYALLVASILLGFLFLAMGASGRNGNAALGCLTLLSIGVAGGIGHTIKVDYMDEYWRLDEGAVYKEVKPSDPGGTHRDASVLEFSGGSFVDMHRTEGYMKAGIVYCVAPIYSSKMASSPQYWAAGENCCDQRGNFTCGDVADPDARAGLRVVDERNSYATAVRMAGSVYGLSPSTDEPVFVSWTSNAEAYKDTLWTKASILAFTSSVVQLLVSIFAGCMLSRVLLR